MASASLRFAAQNGYATALLRDSIAAQFEGRAIQREGDSKAGQFKGRAIQRQRNSKAGQFEGRAIQREGDSKGGRFKGRAIQRQGNSKGGRFEGRAIILLRNSASAICGLFVKVYVNWLYDNLLDFCLYDSVHLLYDCAHRVNNSVNDLDFYGNEKFLG